MRSDIYERITTIQTGAANSYLIGTEKGFVLIDTGGAKSFLRFQSAFDSQNIAFTDLICIVITHTHYDHTGSAAEIQSRSRAPLFVHAAEKEYAEKGFTPMPDGVKPFGKIMKKLAGGLKSEQTAYPSFSPDITVDREYDLSRFGLSGRIIPTPGHTNGSLSILLEDEACFVGDSIFNFFFSSYFPPFANDLNVLLSTWEYLRDLPCSYYYPGHGKPIPKSAFLESFDKLTRKYRST